MNFLKNKIHLYSSIIFLLFLVLIYHRWFISGPIIGGDWPYLFDETIREFPLIVPSWNTWQANGLGGINQIYFLQTFQNATIFFANWTTLSWILVYKVLWFGFFILLSVYSSTFLLKTIFPNSLYWVKLIASIIFTTNTYVLMLADGGQMGVLLAYSITPLILALFIENISLQGTRVQKIRMSLVCGLVVSAQVMFDPRITYLTFIAITIYLLLNVTDLFKNLETFVGKMFYTFIIPGISTIFLHATWILPYILSKQNFASDFGDAYSGVGIVKFLSFASFSQTISLLHPNWPENLFGKTGFMKPEFLLIPIIAYSCLFFIKKNKFINKKVIYMCVLAISGAFLAKGSSPLGGEVYLWLFSNIPGFIFFRDPTKFYIFVILAYSILIPFVLESLSEKLPKARYIIPIIFVVFWIIMIRPAALGELNGTFKYHEVPVEYIQLKDFLKGQQDFSRTLWVPRQNRFTFYSNNHPSVEAMPLFKASSSAEIVIWLNKESSKNYLERLAVKYVIIPYDPMADIFQKDRKYDEATYENLIKEISKISWLTKLDEFGKIAIFQMSQYNDHISITNGKIVSNTMITPFKYNISVLVDKPTRLIFSENYSPYWLLKKDGEIIYSEKTADNLNSFVLSSTGLYEFELFFSQEDYYHIGRVISIATFLVIIVILVYSKKFLLHY